MESAKAKAARSPRLVVARAIALWFGCGLVPRAPGTAGTLGAIPLYLALRPYGLGAVAAAAVVVTIVGIWAAEEVVRETGLKDPQIVCVDEVAGVLVTWLAAPAGWLGTLVGFALFRLFDSTKPFPARACERLPGGFGVVLDDIAAGVWGAAVLAGARAMGWM